MTIISRFAPSPTGYLHLGHAYSAWLGRQRSKIWRLRLEDIDQTRCKEEFAQAIQEDLAWLGLTWDGEPRVQSQHFDNYTTALELLHSKGLLYPCFCTRAEIVRAQSAPHATEGRYPGTCRHLTESERVPLLKSGRSYALRIDTEKASRAVGTLRFFDETLGWVTAEPQRMGDVVLARKDTPTSYHLCAALDDAVQQITHVVRGEDLRDATHIHVLLQALLGYGSPVYVHHKLLIGNDGKRLAKRDNAITLRHLRDAGVTPPEIFDRFKAA